MAIRIAINGFGRIGRQVYKAIRERYDEEIDVVAVNDIGRINIMTHLLKYDTNYGRFPGEVIAREDGFTASGDEVKIFAERDPSRLPGPRWVLTSSSVATWPRLSPGMTTSGATQ